MFVPKKEKRHGLSHVLSAGWGFPEDCFSGTRWLHKWGFEICEHPVDSL
jgi:hypothetical protein